MASDEKPTTLRTPLHMQRNKHPNVNGSPWGWLVDNRGERIATYSGHREEAACEALISQMAYAEVVEAENKRLRALLADDPRGAR